MGNEVIELDDDDDDDFLSMVDAAAAEALARTKRQKLSPSDAASSPLDGPEGPYMAALRGSRSTLWQQQQQQQQNHRSHPKKDPVAAALIQGTNSTSSTTTTNTTDACFKCGMSGHWARDCTNTGGASAAAAGGTDIEVPEKACPCGSGICSVRTSNTAKNPGRKFYRCPLRTEHGGCDFFEWCDSPASGVSSIQSGVNYGLNPSVPDLTCPCGAGACLVLVAKMGNNAGQQYYRCPANEGRVSCGFFKWCNDHSFVANEPAFTSQYTPSSQFSGVSGSPCFKCGIAGHWARDCTNPSSDYNADARVNRSTTSGTGNVPAFNSQYNSSSQSSGVGGSPCFKCGVVGHWARDCTSPSSDYNTDARVNRSTTSSTGTCFKCGKTGHWARDCSSQDAGAGTGSRKAYDSFSSPFNYKSKYN